MIVLVLQEDQPLFTRVFAFDPAADSEDVAVGVADVGDTRGQRRQFRVGVHVDQLPRLLQPLVEEPRVLVEPRRWLRIAILRRSSVSV